MDPSWEELDEFVENYYKIIDAENKKAEEEGRTETMALLVYVSGHGTQDGYNSVLINQEGDPSGSGKPPKVPESGQAQGNEESKEKSEPKKLCVYHLEERIKEKCARRDNMMVVYIHHACRERHLLNRRKGYSNLYAFEVNFVGIYSSPPYGLVDIDTRISTSFWKELHRLADKRTGEILFPSLELLEWKVGSYRDIFKNKRIGEMTCKLKFPIILVF